MNRFFITSSFHHLFKSFICLYTLILISQEIMCCEIDNETRNINCYNTVDIQSYFRELSVNLSKNEKNFNQLYIYSGISEIPYNAFYDITFIAITIYNSTNFKHINTNSFNATKRSIKSFVCYMNFMSQLVNEPPDYDLYFALSTLTNLETLYLSLANGKSHIIPDQAFNWTQFGPQNNLEFVEFYGHFIISSVGNDVFYSLPNIKQIVFKYATVEQIKVKAFRLQQNDQATLNLTLNGSSLTEKSFEPGVFSDIGRIVNLDLTNNSIHVIEERIFDPFFAANKLNKLIMSQNPLNCSDPSFQWILKNKIIYENRIFGAFCQNGSHSTPLWDWVDEEVTEIPTTTSVPTSPENDPDDDLGTIHEIMETLQNLINQTKDENSLNSSEELKDILTQIQEIQNSLDFMNDLDYEMSLNLTTNIQNVLSNLLNQNNAWNNTLGSERTQLSSDILKQIQFTSIFLSCNQNHYNQSVDRITNDNIIADVFMNFDQQINFLANDSSISIPEEVIHMNGISYCGNSSFAALISRLGEYLNQSLNNDQNINTHVISYSLTNSTNSIELDHGINIKFRLKHNSRLEFGDKMICVFWDFSLMDWSSNGCLLLINESNRETTVCQCNHLTNFAAIMDISGREDDSYLKSLLTYIFCGLSIICLILAVCLLLRPQKNNSNTITDSLVRTRTIITLNLSIMLIIADILIIFGMDRKNNKVLCQTMSGILLYALLSSFSWMFLEGYHLYRMTVQIFNSNTRKEFLFLFGYGIPVLIIIIGFTIIWFNDRILFDALIGEYFCWISSERYPNHIWLLIGPALIAIVFNIIMLFMLFTRVFKSSKNKDSKRSGVVIKQIFGITSLLFNLGITWLSFILYIKQFGSYFSYFSYVFIVLNGSQGCFIFIYHLAIHLSKRQKPLKNTIKLTLSNKWSTKTIQTQIE